LNVIIESVHLPDRGETENALNISPEKLKTREVVFIDIGEELSSDDEAQFAEDEIPRNNQSSKALRGPLIKNWSRDVR